MTRNLRRALASFASLLATSSLLASAQEAPKKEFEDAVSVLRIEVPVTVIDRSGEVVRNLGPENFELIDDGQQQEIIDFEVVDLVIESRRAAAQPDRTPRARREGLPTAARRHFMLLFDLSFSQPSSILKAREAARTFVLEQLHPTDLAAVATYSLDLGPQLVLTFTPDRAQLARAIDTLGFHRRRGPAAHFDPLSFLIAPPEGLAEGSISDTTEQFSDIRAALEATQLENLRVIGKQFDRSEKNFERTRITAWSRSMADMAKALNSVGGRKHIVYFSEGFDSRLAFGRGPLGTDRRDRQESLDLQVGNFLTIDSNDSFGHVGIQADLEAMLEEFRRADCIIQAVDIAGLRSELDGSTGISSDGLFYLANETGGELFMNANNLSEQLGELLRHSSVTYLLSFQPTNPGEAGTYHKLKIKIRDAPKRTRVSHRAGYYVPRPFEELHPLERKLLASDAIAAANPKKDVGIQLLAAPFRANEHASYVPLILEIDGKSLLTDHDSPRLAVEIYAYVTDSEGRMRDFFTQEISLLLGPNRASLAQTGLKYYGHFELAEGEFLIRVLVRNSDTGRTGVATRSVEIPAFETREAYLLPPFFVEPPNGWVLVRESHNGSSTGSVVYPFTIDGEPFIPSARPVLSARDPMRLCLIGYNLSDGDLVLEGRVLREDGSFVQDGRLDLVERTVTGISGLDKLEASFRSGNLKEGSYDLEVTVFDPESGSRQTSTTGFLVGAIPPESEG